MRRETIRALASSCTKIGTFESSSMHSSPLSIRVTVPLALILSAVLAGICPVADEQCPCPPSTHTSNTCTCTVQITNQSGYPVGGECEFVEDECGRDQLACEWKGTVTILCSGQLPVAKLFTLATDCGAVPTARQINCTGGSGSITLSLGCEDCP